MRTSLTALATCAATSLLLACSKPTPDQGPDLTRLPSVPGTQSGGSSDSSVPKADSVFPPAPAAQTDPAAARSNSTMTPTQESSAMPLPGQNNDHSAPLTPAKPASGTVTR